MAQPYVGEIRMFAGNFAPAGWMFCDGSVLPISENEVLFQLIGTTYGGDGQETFRLPDLRGRMPIHMGNGFILAETGGAEAITLTVQQVPAHSHSLGGTNGVGHLSRPAGAVPATHRDHPAFDLSPTSPMSPLAVASAGGNQPHDNMPPYLCVSFIISLFGLFPSPT
jgi:microcystin-dependent protein